MLKKIAPIIISGLICVSCIGCTSTKVNTSMNKQAEIEKIDPDDYIELNIPDNLMELVSLTYEDDIVASEDGIQKYIEDIYMDGAKEPEQILDETIEEGDVINIKYTCYVGEQYLAEYSGLKDLNITIGEDNGLPEGLNENISDFLIGKFCSDTYTLPVSITGKKGSATDNKEELKDVVYTIYVNYKVGEEQYPEPDAFFENNSSLQNEFGTYSTFKKSIAIKAKNRNIENAFYSILDQIADNSNFTKDHSLLTKSQYKALYSTYAKTASDYGISIEVYAATQGYSTIESFQKRVQDDAEKLTKEKIVFFALLDQELITPLEEMENINFDSYAVYLSTLYGLDSVTDLIEIYGSDAIRFEILRTAYQDSLLYMGVKDYTTEDEDDDLGITINQIDELPTAWDTTEESSEEMTTSEN